MGVGLLNWRKKKHLVISQCAKMGMMIIICSSSLAEPLRLLWPPILLLPWLPEYASVCIILFLALMGAEIGSKVRGSWFVVRGAWGCSSGSTHGVSTAV